MRNQARFGAAMTTAMQLALGEVDMGPAFKDTCLIKLGRIRVVFIIGAGTRNWFRRRSWTRKSTKGKEKNEKKRKPEDKEKLLTEALAILEGDKKGRKRAKAQQEPVAKPKGEPKKAPAKRKR